MKTLPLLLLLLSACAAKDVGHSGEIVQYAVIYTLEFREIERERRYRSEAREKLRALGYRVCEEGEEGTQWKEDCNTCRCEYGAIRGCTMAHCRHPTDEKTAPQPSVDDG